MCEGEMVDCSGFVKERRLDGKCNNLRDKTTTNWGASAIKLRRMIPAEYDEDDFFKHRPRKVKVGKTSRSDILQVNVSPREVSNKMHKCGDECNKCNKDLKNARKEEREKLSHMAMQFGQFLSHDITLTPEGGNFWHPSVTPPLQTYFTISFISSSRTAVL